MLGHIAIAALGGFYAQDPESGAVVDTYIPAARIRLTGVHTWTKRVEPQDAILERVFDDTQAYTKWEYTMPSSAVTYPAALCIGNQKYDPTNPRTWWYAGAETSHTSPYLCLYTNETIANVKLYKPYAGVLSAWTKRGERRAVMKFGSSLVQDTVRLFNSFKEQVSLLRVGPNLAAIEQEFYVASLVNEYYNTHFLVLPMRSFTSASTALFEHFNPTLQEL